MHFLPRCTCTCTYQKPTDLVPFDVTSSWKYPITHQGRLLILKMDLDFLLVKIFWPHLKRWYCPEEILRRETKHSPNYQWTDMAHCPVPQCHHTNYIKSYEFIKNYSNIKSILWCFMTASEPVSDWISKCSHEVISHSISTEVEMLYLCPQDSAICHFCTPGSTLWSNDISINIGPGNLETITKLSFLKVILVKE